MTQRQIANWLIQKEKQLFYVKLGLILSYNFTPDILLSLGCTSFIGNPRSKTVIDTGAYRSVLYTTNQSFTPWVLFRWSIRKNTKKKIGLENDILRDHEEKFRM